MHRLLTCILLLTAASALAQTPILARAIPAQQGHINPATTANQSNHPRTKSSSKKAATIARPGSIQQATIASGSAVQTGKPCPGRTVGSVQLGSGNQASIV